MLLSLLLIELELKIFCIIYISKNVVKTLIKISWILIVLFISTFGSIAFLIFERKDNYND